jgi:hypothetical protein
MADPAYARVNPATKPAVAIFITISSAMTALSFAL